MMKCNLSIIIPIQNEQDYLEENTTMFLKYFTNHQSINRFEIILIENGSTDSTFSIARKLAAGNSNISLLSIPIKSLGLALVAGIKKAKYGYVYFEAIDNPFNFSDLEKFLQKIINFDLIFASKNHPISRYEKRAVRKIASKIYSFLIRRLFHLPLTDTQGTFLGKKKKLLEILRFCTSKSAFFQTQLAIYATRFKLKVTEVPVDYIPVNYKSHFSIFSDGVKLLYELFREKLRLVFKPIPH